jgi:adenosylcobinamide kinase/adenosylcobinamide-phosphate guanylyltransferase
MTPDIPSTGMTLILGGARSGKSSYAEKIARETGRPVLYIATAAALDDEMRARIANHRAARPSHWQTLEVQQGIQQAVLNFLSSPLPPRAPLGDDKGPGVRATILLDCITLLVSNVLLSLPQDAPLQTVMEHVREEIESLIAAQTQIGGQWLVVSNEVGLGIVPAYPLGRIYRDALGWANQRLAREAARVLFMVAGIPMVVK